MFFVNPGIYINFVYRVYTGIHKIGKLLQSQQLLIETDVQIPTEFVTLFIVNVYNYCINFMHRMGTRHP